jgi:HlyD family secretion protein
MATAKKKSYRIWIVALAVVAVAGFAGYKWWKSRQSALPPGIASGNGRLEAKLVDIAARESLRVKEVLVAEGDLVRPGQVVVRMDTVTLEAELAEAHAAVAAAKEKIAVAASNIASKKSEIRLAQIEADRSRKLVRSAPARSGSWTSAR